MKNSKILIAIIAALITAIIMWWWCRHKCHSCHHDPQKNCDTCYCTTTPLKEADGSWCCGDRLTISCVPDSNRFYTGNKTGEYGNCDIKIDTMLITRETDRIITDIFISNVSDDDAACAKLEVLMPTETRFLEFIDVEGDSKDWQFYDGYMRVDLGQLSTSSGDNNDRHVRMITSTNCRQGINSGIAAFVYSIVPDKCLQNNYAYYYYQVNTPGDCLPTVIIENKK